MMILSAWSMMKATASQKTFEPLVPPQTRAQTACQRSAGSFNCTAWLLTQWVTFTFSFGAVAQLGERYNGIVEVRGSIPLGSTILGWLHLSQPCP